MGAQASAEEGWLASITAEAKQQLDAVWGEAAHLYDEADDVVAALASKTDNFVSFVIITCLIWANFRLYLFKRKGTSGVRLVDIRCISWGLMLITNCSVARWSGLLRSYIPIIPMPYMSSRLAVHFMYSILSFVLSFAFLGAYVFLKGLAFERLRARLSSGTTTRSPDGKKRVAIFHASIGSGHKRAAQAVQAALQSMCDDKLEVQVIDMLDFSTGGRGVDSLYTLMAKKGYMRAIQTKLGAAAYGYFFEQSNQAPGRGVGGISAALTKLVQRAFFLQFYDFLFKWNPDFIISTHFLAPDLVGRLQIDFEYKVPHITVVTDYDAHTIWANLPCTQYFAPRMEASLMLQHAGVQEDIIQICGIPIVPEFSVDRDKAECRERLGLRQDMPVVLQMSGGDDVFDIYRGLLQVRVPINLVVVTGRQADVRSKLEAIKVPDHHVVKLEGFTKEMHNYLTAADIIISKPGGLTTAESMATGTPMVIVNPIPGQETRNTDMLLEAGVAVKINDLPLLWYQVETMLTEEGKLEEMQAKARALGDPQAAFKVARWVLDFMETSASSADVEGEADRSSGDDDEGAGAGAASGEEGADADADSDADEDGKAASSSTEDKAAAMAKNRAQLRKNRPSGRRATPKHRSSPAADKEKEKAKGKRGTAQTRRRRNAAGASNSGTTRRSTRIRQLNQPR